MNEKWVIDPAPSFARHSFESCFRVYFLLLCEQQHDGDYVTNKNRSVKPI
ncbi:hypothetical protein [Bacteroides acidifaciens]